MRLDFYYPHKFISFIFSLPFIFSTFSISISIHISILTLLSDCQCSGYNCASIHVDGALFGVGSADGKLSIWDFKTHDHPVWETAVSHITSLAFSENGFFMATGTADSTVLLWDLRKMQNFHTIALGNGAPVNGVSFDGSGKFLSVASKDLAVYYGKTFTPVKLFNAHTQPVMYAKFGNDAKFIASVSMDRTLKLYGQK